MSTPIFGTPRLPAGQGHARRAPQPSTDLAGAPKGGQVSPYAPDAARFSRRDKDGDGLVSAEQWGTSRKRQAEFALFDFNRDSQLSLEEIRDASMFGGMPIAPGSPVPQTPPPVEAPPVEAPEAFPVWNFNAESFPGFYDASGEQGHIYNVPKMVSNAPRVWETWGPTFEKVGEEFGVDPYAMAAYCMFETYNWEQGNLLPNVQVQEGGLHAAGIAQSQAQLWKGKQVPGLDVYFPASQWDTAQMLMANPEYSIRVLAYLMKDAYETTGHDLAKAFPYTAYPMWGDPGISRGAYGNQAQYVSKAYAFYNALKAADQA